MSTCRLLVPDGTKCGFWETCFPEVNNALYITSLNVQPSLDYMSFHFYSDMYNMFYTHLFLNNIHITYITNICLCYLLMHFQTRRVVKMLVAEAA